MSWDVATAHQRFWAQLQNRALDSLLESPDELKGLRYKYGVLKRKQQLLQRVLDERGTSMLQLVAEAHGEIWDEEDDEKNSPSEVKVVPVNHAVQVGRAREIGVREGKSEGHVLQASDDCGKEDLQEGQGRARPGGGKFPEEAPPKKKSLTNQARLDSAGRARLSRKAVVSETPDEGIVGAKPAPKKKKRVRKRPVLKGKFKLMN